MTPKEFLVKLATSPHADAARFDDNFLRHEPVSKIDEIHAQIEKTAGFQSIIESNKNASD
jgi:hypothetical protein